MVKSPQTILYHPDFAFKATKSGLLLLDHDNCIGRVENLQLFDVLFSPDHPAVIGSDVPLKLYWMQYANHQDPERHAGATGRLKVLQESPEGLCFQCEGYNKSRSIKSIYTVTVEFSGQLNSYVIHVKAILTVLMNQRWHVTGNPFHGEIEFCNFFPQDVFTKDANVEKKYQACYLESAVVQSIPHHHLESSDKHNIPMRKGDRLCYLLEEINPVIEIQSTDTVTAGVCAYMWDTHFAYRNGRQGSFYLPGGSRLEAFFVLYALNRNRGERIVARARPRPAPEIDQVPIYTEGLNRFDQNIKDIPNPSQAWPWSFETDEKAAHFWDRNKGYETPGSLGIMSTKGNNRWIMTALGPAFGGKAFAAGKRYRLIARVFIEHLQGEVFIALRYHLENKGSVFDVRNYETVESEKLFVPTTGWHKLSIATKVLIPAPDRMHIILQQSGDGKSWFDEVLFVCL
jgi:hypothetical protein